MTKRYARALSPAEIAAVPDDAIDFSDIPELDETFWREARVVMPEEAESVTLSVKASVVDAFRAQDPEAYPDLMNAVLETYARVRLRR
jgi:uncharacterized protein (DUF4415 family)